MSASSIDTSYLESLIGYNARRASLLVIAAFVEQMQQLKLRPVEFSILSLIGRNPSVTSRQLCAALSIKPSNIVAFIKEFDQRGWIVRKAHPTDGRATGLELSTRGKKLIANAERLALESERELASELTQSEIDTLNQLLQKLYKS
jgi:DNA-binding MarR family transcriptional regulator